MFLVTMIGQRVPPLLKKESSITSSLTTRASAMILHLMSCDLWWSTVSNQKQWIGYEDHFIWKSPKFWPFFLLEKKMQGIRWWTFLSHSNNPSLKNNDEFHHICEPKRKSNEYNNVEGKVYRYFNMDRYECIKHKKKKKRKKYDAVTWRKEVHFFFLHLFSSWLRFASNINTA